MTLISWCHLYNENTYQALQVTDADLSKEATPDEYIKNILPILVRNGVVHFLGFGNRLGFDPLPSDLQVSLSSFFLILSSVFDGVLLNETYM